MIRGCISLRSFVHLFPLGVEGHFITTVLTGIFCEFLSKRECFTIKGFVVIIMADRADEFTLNSQALPLIKIDFQKPNSYNG